MSVFSTKLQMEMSETIVDAIVGVVKRVCSTTARSLDVSCQRFF